MIADALRVSVTAATVATVAVVVLGTALARALAGRRFRGRALIEAVLTLPLVLPPTVTGYLLLVALGRHGPLGGALEATFGVSVPFTWAATVVAAAVVSFPLMFRSAVAAFESLDGRHALVAASLGHGRWSTFARVTVPLARRGLAVGAALAFARALGEFGATLLLAGNLPGTTQTLPLAIYEAAISGADVEARWLAAALTAVSLAAMLAAARLERGRDR